MLLLEIEACRKAREHRKAAEERKKTVIVGDLQPLVSALLDIDFSTASSSDNIKRQVSMLVSLILTLIHLSSKLQESASPTNSVGSTICS